MWVRAGNPGSIGVGKEVLQLEERSVSSVVEEVTSVSSVVEEVISVPTLVEEVPSLLSLVEEVTSGLDTTGAAAAVLGFIVDRCDGAGLAWPRFNGLVVFAFGLKTGTVLLLLPPAAWDVSASLLLLAEQFFVLLPDDVFGLNTGTNFGIPSRFPAPLVPRVTLELAEARSPLAALDDEMSSLALVFSFGGRCLPSGTFVWVEPCISGAATCSFSLNSSGGLCRAGCPWSPESPSAATRRDDRLRERGALQETCSCGWSGASVSRAQTPVPSEHWLPAP